MKYLPIYLLGLLLLHACNSNVENKDGADAPSVAGLSLSQDELRDMGVEFSVATQGAANSILTLPASVIVDQARIGTAVSLVEGRIKEVAVNIGDRVAKGDVLATIESMQISSLIAGALRYKVEMDIAKKEFDRLKSLHENQVTSNKVIERAESDYLSAKAEYYGTIRQLTASGMTETEIAALDNRKDNSTAVLAIRSPISGTVSARNASSGSRVQLTEELFVIVNNTHVTVEAHAYQDDLRVLRHGMSVEFATKAYPGKVFNGKLSVVSAVLDAETHTLPVRCTIPNPDGTLKPNLNGELRIQTGELKTILSIPSDAIIYDGNDTYVFRDNGTGTLEYTLVTTGQTYGDRIEITGGLNAGNRIASKAVFTLKSKYKLSQSAEE